MARTSSVYYIAPSAISIVPNCNGSANDLAVTISRGTKIKVFAPGVARLGINPNTNSFREWTLTGRNRRLNCGNGPYTIYARLQKSEAYVTDGSAYLVFAAQSQYGEDNPYGLAGQWFDKYSYVMQDGLAGQYDERGFPNIVDHPDYWWIKLGTVSELNESSQRTVDLDTGILGTEEYNNRWRLNPDDLPDKPVRTVITDRGTWAATPHVIYHGLTGTRTPDGTLDVAVAAALGWEGTEPLTFTNGEPIAEPYHRESLTRQRFISKRLDSENAALTDAELYEKLTNVSKGWEEENELETSRAWLNGALWECLTRNTAETPRWGCTDWKEVGGDTVYYCEIISSAGTTFRNGNVSTVLTMEVRYGQEVITDRLAAQPGTAIVWGRCTLWNPTTRRFEPTSEDKAWTATPVPGEPYSIRLERSDLGSGWMTDYRQALIHCSIYAPDADGSTEEYPADFITSI